MSLVVQIWYFQNWPNGLTIQIDFSITISVCSDAGYFGLVYYQFRSLNSPFCFDKLTIGERNGEIRVKSALDYEETVSFSCVIEAFDHDASKNPQQTSSAVLNVLLVDVNDNKPQLKSEPLTFTGNSFSTFAIEYTA